MFDKNIILDLMEVLTLTQYFIKPTDKYKYTSVYRNVPLPDLDQSTISQIANIKVIVIVSKTIRLNLSIVI